MKSAGFHEIRMKSGRFHEIRMKSGGFQVKSTPNLVKSEEFLLKHLHLISETSDFMVKSAGFHERELLGDDQV